MMESVLKRIERNRKERDRWIALVLCLSMIVSLGVFSGLRMDAIAKTYTRVVLECPYMEEGAERVVHTHNADCYDEYGNLACTLPELEAHTHSDACYLENTTLVCGLEENPGHRHTDDCYTAVTTLACDLEENEGHQHTGDCYTLERGELLCDNTDEEHEHTDDCYVWNEVLSCGMEAGEGAHLHSEDCYRTEWILTCGMEEGEGAHTHTDECYLTDRVLICDKPEIVLHTHTDDCYQKNDDGSIYVDEDGYAWLICGQPEIIEHVHDADCFAVYELDDGEPEEISVTDEIAEPLTEDTDEAEPAATEEHEEADDADAAEEKSETEETDNLTDSEETKDEAKDETKDETKDNTKDDTEDENEEETESTDTEADVPAVPMPAQSFEKLAGGIRVSVEAPEGAFPENTRMSASPVNGNSLKNTVSDAINGEVLEVQAVDIKFYDAEGNEIEPATPIRVAITPWASAHVDQTTQVVHIDKAGDAEVIEQAADAEPASEREVVFDADSFSIYAIVYSVSFEYEVDGQVFTSSVPGAREIMLSDVLKELNITAEDKIADFMSRIADVSVSAADVLSVTAVEADWTICALKASEDVAFLTVTMQDGAVFSIAVKADGATEVTSENEIAVISTANDRYLPENATALAEVLDEEKSESAIAAVQELEETQGAYQVFSIGLENVDATAYDGFNVSVTLPEDAVVGKDFQLYQIREDETVNLTESLEVTGEPNENGLQNVSGFTFKTDDFADFVLSYSIETNYTAFDGKTFKIALNYGPEAEIPEGAALKVEEILPETESYAQYLNDSVTELGVKSGAVSFARFFDIEIQKDGEKVEPQAPVSVTIQMLDLPEETGNAEAQVIHFGEQTEVLTAEAAGTDVSFETGSFSVYGVLYTVDFHYEVNGQTFEFSIPGGGFISLEHLIEVLGINVSDAAGTDSATDEAFGEENEEEEYTDNSAETAAEETAADPVAEVEAAATAAFEQAISLNNVPVSEETRAFVAEIAAVEFSSPELVWVGKVNEESTVGALKEANGLEVEYSADLTEEQIAEINAQTVEAGDWALVSVRPFVSEESLTVTMENGDSFTIRVTDGQIRKTVIDAKGDTWEITVTYGDDAQIPDGAELNVREILPTDEEYEALYNSAAAEACSDAEKQGIGMPVPSGARLFDIEILGEDGKIEPSAPVQVSIRLVGAADADYTSVVHFGVDGAKALTAQTSEIPAPEMQQPDTEAPEEEMPETRKAAKDTASESVAKEVIFQADSFSVYTVVNVTDFGSIATSDKKYALVTGIAGDPGATTGYSENWGRDYFTIIVNAHAMSDQSFYDNQNRVDGFQVQPVHAYEDGGVSYIGGSPAQWQFESAGNGKYYLSVNGKYLQRFNKGNNNDHQWGWEARLVDNRNEATQLSIDVNSDGTILIHDGNFYLHNDGNGEWATRVFKFRNDNEVNINSAAYRFRVCEESELFDSFAAKKVSVQDLTVNDRFLIYRKFEDSQGNEQLYALASDGTFVRVYDGGDTVYWRETDKNLYWNYRMEGGYYSIYSTNPATGGTVYINPMHSDPSQTISTEPSRLTLIGKDNGEYGTALENWDQTAYDYAGLHVTLNAQGVPVLSTGTRVAGTSDEFLFAVASTMPADAAEKVETVDSEALGIHITIFDYGRDDFEYNAGDKLNSMADVVASNRDVANNYQPHQANALVKPYLEDDLPSSKTKGAMAGLFTPDGSAVTYSQSGVTNLFLKSYYDESGMFRYRSEDNFAYLGKGGNTSFTVYRQAATPYPYDTAPGHTYYTHGHYMPFNDIDMTTNVSRLMNQYGNDYQDGQAVGELPVGDGRTYEDIYGTQGIPNFFTGMKMEADFTQPRGGTLENGDDMVFKFTGDDDMWVYIDGVLVLDIGGIHEPLSGTINFATGIVTNPTGSSLAGEKTLYQIFMNVLNNSSTPQDVKDRINSITWKDVDGDGKPDTFADYTNHDFKAFYMERGAGASNLDIQFNLKVTLTDEFVVQKQIPDGIDPRFVNQEYKFQATYKDQTDNNAVKPLFAGARNLNGTTVCTKVYYRDRRDESGRPIEVPVPVNENGYFTLRAGEAAVFKMADESIEYTVKEVEINAAQTEQVEINGQVVTVSSDTAEAAYARVSDRSQLNYKNHPFLQNLNIIKHLLPENTQAGPDDVFEFRVYLESTVEADGQNIQQLVPYSYGPYYVTKLNESDNQIHYFTLTGENNAPEDKGTTPVVCSTTGRSGSINSIPPEYTVVIPNLAVGTHFYIEERRDNIPAGYVFDHENLIENTYDAQTLGTDEDIISRILARDEKDHQAFDPGTIGKIRKDVDAQSEVYNRKVYVNVQKQWLRLNGQPYTLEEARQLPGSTDAVITAELWKKKIVQETDGETDTPVTVTFMVNTTEDTEYRQVSVPVAIKKGSTLEFSLGANKTSQAQEIHTDPEYSVSRSSVSSNPKITYSNGRQKDKWSKYTISGINENTTVYATFDAAKVSDDFVGLYIASMEAPGSSEAPAEEKVADITLNNANDWLQQFSMDSGYTYFLMNIVETGLGDHAHEYTFIDAPTVTTDTNGNITLAVANKYREPINITVEKVWSPALTSEEESAAYVKVELHRYAKKTKGILTVVLRDNYGAPIEGAVFKLYKDGVEQAAEYVTDVNGKVVANNLEPGTYYFKQISTPEGYRMPDSVPQTDNLVVEDNSTAHQELHFELQNQAIETNGVATLTLLDNNGNPVQGAKYNLIKREGSQEVVLKEGLVTDANGQITVSQLKAGTYYFFETEPPADYNLPDSWQDTDFTVLERPGTVQTFDLHMTNNLKGKGYVEITLNGPEGAIDGAQFELYKDSEKIAEGTTSSNGTLTFGTPDLLHAGIYYVRQVTTNADLLPANQQSFTIHDNGNANQKNELTFTNPYRGKGTATVTLTRKDNGAPISGATFELYKDGSLFDTKTTDSNGQLTFGSPDKLAAGNYSIKQASTVEGLEPVVNNWPFEILENGNPNQAYSWNVQNEENAGNVTIKLWRKQGLGQYNWEQVAVYNNLKPGKTYSFTAELKQGMYAAHCWFLLDESENNYNRNLQATELTGIGGAGTWDGTNNTYHFTITPTKDNTTYSYVLATDWGANDIKSMTMDEPSRLAMAPASSLSMSKQVGKLDASRARLLSSAEDSSQMSLNDQVDTSTSDSGSTAVPSGTNRAGDASTVVSPSGPPSSDYIVDSGFVETYTITKADDNWKHVFNNLDKCDQDENPYYYYVVETECKPASYHVASYTNDNLTDTGTITVTNEQKPGALTIEKHVTVNDGTVPDDVKTIADGDYIFSVSGPNNYSETVTVTVSQGASGSTVLNNLTPGTYTITETGTTNKNGVNLITTPQVVVVARDSAASANIASFTNNLETTSIIFAKAWSVTGKDDTEVTYTLFQVAEPTAGGDPVYDNVYVGDCTVGGEARTGSVSTPITFTVTKNSPVTVTNLPKAGMIGTTPVTYKYYALEAEIEGFAPNSPEAIAGGTYTITNTPIPASATFEDVQVEKEWMGEGADQIGGYRFKLTQERAELSTSVVEDSGAFHPITIRTVNGDGSFIDTVYYVAAGKNIAITATRQGNNAGNCIYQVGSTSREYPRTFTVNTAAPLGGYIRIFKLSPGHAWGTDWSISAKGESSASNVSTNPRTFIEKLSNLNYSSSYDGQLVLRVNVPRATTASVDGNAYTATAENWKATVQNLPYYYYDSAARKYYTYQYRVEELSIINEDGTELEAVVSNADGSGGESHHFTVSYDNSSNPLKITNTLKNKITLNIYKVDATDMETPIGKAQFTLTKLDPEDRGAYMTGSDAVVKVSKETNDETGATTIPDIADGYYEISESKIPAGYVLAGDGRFYIRVSGDEIKLLVKDETKPVKQWEERTLTEQDKLRFDAQTNTATVGNIPGVQLPQTGGIGTNLFTVIGGILSATAGAILTMTSYRRRKKQLT